MLANHPFALAPGMGLNSFFAYTVVQQMGYSWQTALTAVFAEGIIFILLSVTNVREAIFNAIPCFICIFAMPFFYSVAEGISMGIISYVVLHLASGKTKEKKTGHFFMCWQCYLC